MTTRANSLERMLEQIFDASTPLDARLALLVNLRQDSPDLLPRFERAVLQRDQVQAQSIRRLDALIADLRATAERLAGAPMQEGVFAGPCTVEGRNLARVVFPGPREMILELLDEAILPALKTGDRVVVSTAGNVVLGRSAAVSGGPGECAVVERWLGAERLVLRHRDQTLVARAAATLTPENLEPGATVRLDPLSGFAMECVPPREGSPYAAADEATSLPPEALAGYDDIRDGKLRQICYAIAHPAVASAYGLARQRPWLLLAGPPGVGKSTFARVIAGVVQRETGNRCRIRRLNGAELLSPYVGETEQRIRAFVREARDDDTWSIFFIDEVDAIARARGIAGNVHSDRFLSTWLAELEGFDGRTPCIVIAATNRLDMVDAAFRSRCSEEIRIPRPWMQAARAIFSRHLGSELFFEGTGEAAAATRARMIEAAVGRLYLPNAPGALLATLRLRDGKTREVFARDLISGRLIEQICIDARKRAFRRHVEGDASGMRLADIDAAVDGARDRLRSMLTPSNAHTHLDDLPHDTGVVAVEPAPPVRGSVAFIREAA